MPKYLGSPMLVERRTYVSGIFRGKFAGNLDPKKSDLTHENFYDLQFLEGEVDTEKSKFRNWRLGEVRKFRKIDAFPGLIFNPIICNIAVEGTTKHFKINLHEPKIWNPTLSNRVYDDSSVFTTVTGEISGYIVHPELAGTVVQLPEIRSISSVAPASAPGHSRPTPAASGNAQLQQGNRGCLPIGSASGCLPSLLKSSRNASGGLAGCSGRYGVFAGCSTFVGSLLILTIGWAACTSMCGILRGPGADTITNQNSQSSNSSNVGSKVQTTQADTPERIGRFTTNEHLRASPNPDAESVAIHFKDARFKVLDEATYQDGNETVKWYKVQVFEYGCDINDTSRCGKNDPDDQDVGWLNAKFVSFE